MAPFTWHSTSPRTTQTSRQWSSLSQRCSTQMVGCPNYLIQTNPTLDSTILPFYQYTTTAAFAWTFCRLAGVPPMTCRPFSPQFSRYSTSRIQIRQPTPSPDSFTLKTEMSTSSEWWPPSSRVGFSFLTVARKGRANRRQIALISAMMVTAIMDLKIKHYHCHPHLIKQIW